MKKVTQEAKRHPSSQPGSSFFADISVTTSSSSPLGASSVSRVAVEAELVLPLDEFVDDIGHEHVVDFTLAYARSIEPTPGAATNARHPSTRSDPRSGHC